MDITIIIVVVVVLQKYILIVGKVSEAKVWFVGY